MRLGEALRRARESAGLTQEEVAFRAGLDRTYVNYLEREKRSPSVKVFVDYCVAVGVRAAAIMDQVEKTVASEARSKKGRHAATGKKPRTTQVHRQEK